MPDDVTSPWDPAFGLLPELGDLARNSGRLLNERSTVELDRAMNLLEKALHRIAAANTVGAQTLVARAAALGWNDREESSPGIAGATMLVYNLVDDWLEHSPSGDGSWLEVALEVHEIAEGPGKAELASILHGFVLQEDLFDLDNSEIRRIRAAVGRAPLEADLGDRRDISVPEKESVIWSLLRTAALLEAGYNALVD